MMQSLLVKAVEIVLVLFGSLTMVLLLPGIRSVKHLQMRLARTLQTAPAKTVLSGLALVTAFVVLEGYQSMNFLDAESKRLMIAENYPAALRASSSLCGARENFFVAALALGTIAVCYRMAQMSLYRVSEVSKRA
jgi:flagellar biosynthesis protein FliP